MALAGSAQSEDAAPAGRATRSHRAGTASGGAGDRAPERAGATAPHAGREPGDVRAVSKALLLLDAISREEREAGVNHLATSTGLPASTAHRLLATLQRHGFVSQNASTHGYSLGPALFDVMTRVIGRFDLRRAMRPAMESLAAATQETVHLAVPVNLEIVEADVIESQQAVAVRRHLGLRLPLHATAVGKAFLAFSERFRGALADGRIEIVPLTSLTVRTRESLDQELALARARGYTVNFRQRNEQTAGVAAPVFNRAGEMVGALGVSGPTSRLRGRADLDRLAGLLLEELRRVEPPGA